MHRLLAPILLSALAFAGSGHAQELSPGLQAQAHAIQAEKASRSPAQSKLESQLHYLSREAAGLPAVAGAPALKARVTLEKDGQVIVDISAVPSAELRSAIIGSGGRVLYESVRWSSVSASLPPAVLADFALRADVKRITPRPHRVAHTVTNEAAAAEKVTTASPQFGVTGAGVKIGVVSNSDDHSEESVAAGELPDFTVLPGRSGRPDSGEGTAMSEIIHDLAPGASIFFAAAGDGKPFMADSILALKAKGCKVIVDDISFASEWQFQDDEIGQAINEVVAGGAVYLSSSGNEGNLKNGNSTTWEGDFLDGGALALLPGGTVHNFKTAQTPQNFNRLSEAKSGVNLQWSDEYHSSANDYDLYILNAAGTAIVASSTNKQMGHEEPMESIDEVKPGERIVIWKATAAAARYLRLSCTGSKIEVQTAGQTIGHAATANCICVASADASKVAPGAFTGATVLDDASSDGPHQMFYQPDGTPFTAGNFLKGGGLLLQTPAITAGDGGQTSVVGFKPFYGTSAAAPAAAAIAALVWERNPALTNAALRLKLEGSCIDIEDVGFDINSGNGILMADLALANATGAAELAVEQPALTNLTSGGSRSFGSVALAGTGTLVFTVRNVGGADLTGVATSIVGPDQADFSVSVDPAATVAGPVGTTSFTVLFQPTIAGLKSATLHLASSDADESDFTIALSGLAPDPASIAQSDLVTVTTGATRYRPLANDKKTSDPLYIVSVSDPSITILDDGRTLLIPEGFVGTFIYTASDGTTSGDAAVTVVPGTPIVVPKAWNGLLYDNGGFIGGALKLTLARGTLSGTLNLGTGKATFSVPKFAGTATRNTTLGSLTVTQESTGQMTVELETGSTYTGSLRPAKTVAVKEQLNIILAADDVAVPGGAYATAKVTALGAVTCAGKLPDGRAFTAGSVLADNDSFIVYAVVSGTSPKAVIAGEFSKADLARTDVTGELEWDLPMQKTGLHKGGLFTVLTGNGCDYTLPAVLPGGPATLTIAGGNLAADSSGATTATAGKPGLAGLLKAWTVNKTAGTFTCSIKDPDRVKAVAGSGIYFPKTGQAWGFFPGTTVGGSILLTPDAADRADAKGGSSAGSPTTDNGLTRPGRRPLIRADNSAVGSSSSSAEDDFRNHVHSISHEPPAAMLRARESRVFRGLYASRTRGGVAMTFSSETPIFGILDCLTGELREIAKMPFEIGSGEAADLRIADERIRERHCVVLEAKGKTYIAKRDAQAAFMLDGVERESSVLEPGMDYLLQLGPKIYALRGSRDLTQWRDRVVINSWCLMDKHSGFTGGPYPLTQLPRMMRTNQLDPESTIAHLEGMGSGLYVSQLLGELGATLEEEALAAEPPPEEPVYALPLIEELADEGPLTCPVCWLHFDKGDVMHVAVHETLKGDPIMGEDAMQRFKARSFNDRGQALDGLGLPCTDIACPHCRRKLPPGFLDVPHHIFSIVGAPQAGKSYYLSVLIKTLQDSLFNSFGVTLDDADPTANAMLNQMKSQLFGASDPESAYLIKTSFEGEMYETLRRQGRRVKLPKPFIFAVASNQRMQDACSLVFYDNAGEHFQPGVDTTESPGAQHIASSAAIFFLFDPTYNAAFRRRLNGASQDPQLFAKAGHLDQQDIILSETKIRIRKILNLGPRDRVPTPLAVLVGKCDTWIDLVGREKLKHPMHDGTLDLGAIDANSALIREFLAPICPSIVGGAESLSSEVKYFPVSPLGHSPVRFTDSTGAEKLGPDPMQLNPLYMEIPSLWALSKVAPTLVPAFS